MIYEICLILQCENSKDDSCSDKCTLCAVLTALICIYTGIFMVLVFHCCFCIKDFLKRR